MYTLGYMVALAALGFHLHGGWGKAVTKMGLPDGLVAPAAALMQALIWPLCLGFASVPLYLFYQSINA